MMADQATVLRLLKNARGQIDGIIKMVEDDRYCMDISQQIMRKIDIVDHRPPKAYDPKR